MSELEQRQLVTRGGALSALSQHPSWAELEAEVGRKRARLERHVLAQALSAGGFSQREADYLRGFISGIEWLVAVPTRAESTLERYLKEQGIALESEAQ